MSLVTWGELRYGAEKSRLRERALQKLADLIALVPVLPMTQEVGKHYGSIRNAVARSGTPIGANNPWIAAHALAGVLVLVSTNLKESGRVERLKKESWVGE